MKQNILFLLALSASITLQASPIIIQTDQSALVYNTNDQNQLRQVYFGDRLTDEGAYGQMQMTDADAFPTFGGVSITEAAVRMVHADGNTSTELVFDRVEQKTDGNIAHTDIYLKDPVYPVCVVLHYDAYQKQNIIRQWMSISHKEKKAIALYDFASSYLSFFAQDYWLTYFHGNWAHEMNREEVPLTYGIQTIDSKIGARSDQYVNACFLVSMDGKAQENSGAVVGGQLAWPGSWSINFEVDPLNNLHILSGMNEYASQYILEPKEELTTPALIFTYSTSGTGTVSRRFHSWAKQYGIHRGDRTRTTLLNNWEATYFDFNEEILTQIIHDAADMGFELFLLDDGWFANKYPRNDDHAGLGDWETNHTKLPHGLGYLVEESQKQGIRFGIWLEPEMVNPKSELYEKHPDWVITQPGREINTSRNQMMLDLCNPKVQDFVFGVIDRTMTENPGIAYIKWDCNRYMTNAASPYLPKNKKSHLFIDYSRGLFKVLDRVRAKYPDTFIMLCSGGGGRINYGLLPYFDEFWISDNTDALDRVFIQWGTTYFYPAMALASHVSVTPNHITGRTTPLKFRFDVAMSAKLGMDLQPMHMSEEDKTFAKNAIKDYYSIRHIVQFGDLYRLLSPYENQRTAMMYVTEDKEQAVVFSYLLKKDIYANRQVLYLQGLDPKKEYVLTELNKDPKHYSWLTDWEGKTYTGEYLMKYGIRFPMYNEFDSKVILLKTAAL